MSQPESQTFHFSPSPGHSVRPTERDQHPSFSVNTNALTSFPQSERRQSVNGLGPSHSTFGNGSDSRSSGLYQSLFSYNSINDIQNTNKTTPSLPSQYHASRHSSLSAKSHTPTSPTPVSISGNSSAGDSTFAANTTAEREGSAYCKPGQHTQSFLAPNLNRSTLCWRELEPWMDEEYAKQVCGLMGWDPVNVKVPHSPPDPTSGQHANNPGYCFLTFPNQAHAAAVLAQVNGAIPNGKSAPPSMPNSNKPFVMNWASNFNPSALTSLPYPILQSQLPAHQHQKEYSIFVGDLAPETSNSDLVAVFRNPVLGLRTDREPKFIRPFLSCKSAKIMLDPVTGVSRGYGFVRFTDEADQQRALIEMHGLYCLSRPMRISPATAKFKSAPPPVSFDVPPLSFTPPVRANGTSPPVTLALPLPDSLQAKSVSGPIAVTAPSLTHNGTQGGAVANSTSGSFTSGSNSSHSLSSDTASSASVSTSGFSFDDVMSGIASPSMSRSELAQLVHQYNNLFENEFRDAALSSAAAHRYQMTEESMKHHVQARAILSNIMGPNGEQLTSTDPYNTTVFVGGLSPLISEDTLRTFFAPFGDIHYVKVPGGKNCGFVQFVRKADAEQAIKKMQGFPIGGSRIRLSWGRSQYKAAQAAAQAAQAAALQSTYTAPPPAPSTYSKPSALSILRLLGLDHGRNGLRPDDGDVPLMRNTSAMPNGSQADAPLQSEAQPDRYFAVDVGPRNHSMFSPFSPDPTHAADPFSQSFLHAGFSQDLNMNVPVSVEDLMIPPMCAASSSGHRYSFADHTDALATLNKSYGEPAISRPGSGHVEGTGPIHDFNDFNDLNDLNGTLAGLELEL